MALPMNRTRAGSGEGAEAHLAREACEVVVQRVRATPLSESTSTAPSLTSVAGESRCGLQERSARQQADESRPDRHLEREVDLAQVAHRAPLGHPQQAVPLDHQHRAESRR